MPLKAKQTYRYQRCSRHTHKRDVKQLTTHNTKVNQQILENKVHQ